MSQMEAACQHLEQLIEIERTPELRDAILAVKHVAGKVLFERARGLLVRVEAVPTNIRVAASGEVGQWDTTDVRQVVVPFGDGENRRELILAGVSGEDVFDVDPAYASFYIRNPSDFKVSNSFAPGSRLFQLNESGANEGPVTDPVLVDGYLDIVEAHIQRTVLSQ